MEDIIITDVLTNDLDEPDDDRAEAAIELPCDELVPPGHMTVAMRVEVYEDNKGAVLIIDYRDL